MNQGEPASLPPAVLTACRGLGVALDPVAVDRLIRYRTWLIDEAAEAGGIGPAEAGRVDARHLADSLAFAAAMGPDPAGALLDVGSGVGLPGIPLAIVLPELEVTLLDRSGRRADLAARAVRILDLDDTVTVQQGDLDQVTTTWRYVTMRAVLPWDAAVTAIRPLLESGGVGIVAASRRTRPVPPAEGWGPGVEELAISSDVLDSPGWLLTISP